MAEIIFFGFMLLIVAWIVFVFFTKRGRGFMFGDNIVKTWDGVKGKIKIVSSQIKVHAVDASASRRLVGLEISSSTVGSYQMIPISLPASEALELSRLLREAAEYRSNHGS